MAAAITAIAAAVIVMASAGPVAMGTNWRLGQSLAPLDWQVQTDAASQSIAAKDAAGAVSSAVRALVANPFNAKALTIIGSTRSGPAGTRLLNQSAALGWRDPLTNFRLIDQAMRERDLETAAQRIDAVGRTLGAEKVTRFADQLLLMPGGIAAMADRASHHLGNGWIPDWMAAPAGNANTISARSAFVSGIDSADGPWKRYVVRRAGDGFSAGGDTFAGYLLWHSALADRKLLQGVIYDGGFSQPVDGSPLGGEWQFYSESPVTIEPGIAGGLQITARSAELGSILAQSGIAQHSLLLEARWTGAKALVEATSWRYVCRDASSASIQRPVLTLENQQWVQRTYFTLASQCKLAAIELDLARPAGSDVAATLVKVLAH